MKKLLSAILIFSMLSFSACSVKYITPSADTQNTSKENSSSKLESTLETDSKLEYITQTTNQSMQETLKIIPVDFTEAIEIETKRQAVLIEGCGAEMGNATYTAFGEMKDLYDTYCNKVLDKLDENQKDVFEDMLIKEKQYNIAFDMFSHNPLQQYVFTMSSANCSQAYNIIKTKTIMMYYYYNYFADNAMDKNNYTNVLNQNFADFFFFNNNLDEYKNKSKTELIGIDNKYSPLLKNIFKEDSKPVFDDYKIAFDKYILSLEAFEKSINLPENSENILFYHSLKSAFAKNLYNIIKDIDYPEEIQKLFNLSFDNDKYIADWN